MGAMVLEMSCDRPRGVGVRAEGVVEAVRGPEVDGGAGAAERPRRPRKAGSQRQLELTLDGARGGAGEGQREGCGEGADDDTHGAGGITTTQGQIALVDWEVGLCRVARPVRSKGR